MIFKTTLTDINKMAVAIDKISTMTLPNYSGLGIVIEGLTAKQAALVLSTRNLSQAELEEVVIQNDLISKYGAEQLVKTGLLSANSSLLVSEKIVNAEKLKERIIQESLNKEKAKEFIQTQLSIVSDGEESTSTIILNKALMDEAIKRGILTKEKAYDILSTYGVITADKLEVGSKKGLIKTIGKLISANKSLIASTVGITALVTIMYKLSKVAGEARERAQELGDSFKETSSTIDDYKSKIEELYKVINDESSSIEDTTNARKSLLSIQDELIDKFGTEESVINNVTDAINGQTEALDKLSKAKWQETKNDFTHGGFWNDTANFFQGTDNIERMLDEYGEKTISIKWADYTDINKLTDEMVAELENIGIDIKVSTDNLQAVRDFDSLTESIEDTKGASLSLSGNAEEIYNKLLALQNLIGNDDSFDKLYDKVGNTADSYKELTDKYKNFYDQYILQEKIFADDSKYTDTFKNITDAAEKYNEAFTSGDETKIKEAADEYANLVSTAMATAIANGDSDVATYFENMYPTLKTIVDGWNFNIAFDTNANDLQGKVQTVLNELKDENGRSLTAEEILGLGTENKQYRDLVAIANIYNMTLDEMIELLKERNLVSAMDYQGLVGLFGQENVDKLSPEDLEIAYTIKNVGNMTFEELQAEIQRLKESANETPVSFSSVLTTSKESLDKFQSSVKSAYDAYSTLLSGNYSSSDLLDSIQSINQAITDMGGSINWELINTLDTTGMCESLELLGTSIEHVSEEYAKSILVDAGIDVNSDFGKMLANMVREAYEAEAEFAGMNAQLDNLQSSYQTLTGILESYNETGYISLDNLQSLLTADENLITMLEVENGQLAINQEAYENLVAAQLMEFKAKLNDAAAAEIETLAKNKAEQATNSNASASNNAVEKLDAETAAINRNTSAAISNAVAKAEESGVSEGEIQGVLDKYNEIWNATLNNFSGDFSGFMGGGTKSAGKAGKEAADAFLESFEKELSELDDLKDRGKITEKQYLDALRRLYLKYFRDKEKYLKEYEKYEHQYLDGMKSLYESAFSYITKQIDKRIDALNDEKDAAVSALEAERDARLEAIEAEKERLENEIDGIDKQIKAKEKEIKAMQDANEERKRAIDLQKAEYELQRMQNQRTSLVYKDGQMVYEADTSGIRDAKQEVEDKKLEIDISKIEKEIDLLEEQKDLLQDQIDLLDKQADQINKYYDNLIKQTEAHYDSMIKGMEDYKSQFEELTELLENAQMEAALQELGINMDALLNGSQEEFEKLKTAYVGILADMSRGNDDVLEQLSRLSGISAESISYLDNTKGAFDNLGQVDLGTLPKDIESVAASTGELSSSASDASTAVSDIGTNASIASGNISPLNKNLTELNKLLDELVTLFSNLKFPEPGSEEYAQKLKDIAEGFGAIAEKCREFQKIDFSSIIGSVGDMENGMASGVEGGTGFTGLASAISDAVTIIELQMSNLQLALNTGNTAFNDQIKKIQNEYIPAWEELQTRLAEIIGVGSGGDKEPSGNKTGSENEPSKSADDGSIIGIMQTGGEEVASKLKDPWLSSFNEFATGENSIQSICNLIIEIVQKMAQEIQEQCAAAAQALDDLAEKALNASISVGKDNEDSHKDWMHKKGGYKGTVGNAFASGTTEIESLPITGYKGLPSDEKKALRSEYGQPELTVYPDGTTELTTEPVMSDLPKGTVIFNEEQTRRIMNNKGEIVGNAYDEGTITLSDGTQIRPLNPSDREYWLVKKFDEYFKENRDAFIRPANAMFKAAESMDKVTETINNNHTMAQNISVNIGDINLQGVQDVNSLSKEIVLRMPNMLLQEMHRM